MEKNGDEAMRVGVFRLYSKGASRRNMKYSRKNKKIRRNKKIKYKNTRKIKYIHTSGYGSLQKGGEIITTEDEYYKVLEASDPKLYGLTYSIEKKPNYGYNALFSNSLNDYLRRLLDTIISIK